MPYLSKKRVWTRQPRFTVSAQTFFGLPITHLWALNVAGEMAIADSAGNAPGVFDPGTVKTGVYWANGHDGSQYIKIDNTGTGTVNSTTIFVGDTTGSGAPKRDIFTFLCRFYATGVAAEGNIYCGPAGGVGIRITPGGLIQLMKENVAQVAITSNAFSFSAWHWLAVSYDGTTAKFYLDKTAVESGGSSYSFVKSGQYTFCSRYVEGSGAVYRLENGSKLSNVMIVDGVLSSDAIHSYFDNPWQAFKKQDRRIWIPSAGGGVHTTTSILTSDVATISGTSLHKILHTVVGNLTSSAATLTGTSVHTTPSPTHNTVGVLSASNSSITGIAARYREHQTNGILTTTNATINGTTNNFSVITSTGVLSSDVATLAGVMSITPAPGIHISTGVLQSNSSTITGILTHTATGHTLTGTLVSSVATLNGNVAHNIIHSSSGTLVSSVATINGTASSSGIMTLTPADIEAIANAVWQHPWALTLPKWLALK